MNAINRKSNMSEVKPVRQPKEMRKNREKPSFLRSGANPSNGIMIGRMDQEESPDPHMQALSFGARVQFAGKPASARQSVSPRPKGEPSEDPLAAFIKRNNEANRQRAINQT